MASTTRVVSPDVARSVGETLEKHAERTERDRRPAPESIAAVRDAGLFAMAVPRSADGAADVRTQLAVLRELGRGCASTAWITGLTAGAKAVLLGTMPEPTRELLLAEPDAIVAGSGAARGAEVRPVADGLVLSGRWQFTSGCEDADYAFLIAPAQGGFYAVLVPTRELTVERDWHVAGMAGTGSHTLVAREVAVPAGRIQPAAGFSVRPATQTGGVVAMLAPLVGATRGAWEDMRPVVQGDRKPYGSRYRRISDSALARQWFSEATRLIEEAERDLSFVAAAVDAGDAESLSARIQLRTIITTSARRCREAMERLLDLGGMSGFTLAHPLQRRWRDVSVGTRHPQFNAYLAEEDHGRALFGVDEPMSTML
ncbi:acyl-CoA dehydrogenase [Virgisporangium aliadipatigenens]|uniref:Acyl-CoA dehydrogenase n=1 Tax=Virgisporangium aliadipatigenens TaxID=741659 RepID=A0A8J3YMI0_9ACTN|nr:acyl-CoA dehydrogenase family protein [Virgisporangium aliadipatigenens]GIJ48254.1 acyl-CoA dehydrogenase [Virgisporangium aliadipatigenens]